MISFLKVLILRNDFIFLGETRLDFTPLIGQDLGRIPVKNIRPIIVDLATLLDRVWVHVLRRSS